MCVFVYMRTQLGTRAACFHAVVDRASLGAGKTAEAVTVEK